MATFELYAAFDVDAEYEWEPICEDDISDILNNGGDVIQQFSNFRIYEDPEAGPLLLFSFTCDLPYTEEGARDASFQAGEILYERLGYYSLNSVGPWDDFQ